MKKIKVGSVVRLKSGGPRMTVEQLIERHDRHGFPKEELSCGFFEGSNYKNLSFNIDCLELEENDTNE